MTCQFTFKRRIEFSDTDLAGIVHFANYFRYMEAVEHAFYRSLGLSVNPKREGNAFGWPRVSASCDYKAPLRFEDDLEIQLIVSEKRSKSLTYLFIFRKLENGHPLEVARGKITAVSAEYDPVARTMKAVPLPKEYDERIETAPPELLK